MSEQKKEPDIVDQLDEEIAVCRKYGWPQTEAFLGAAKREITRLRAERPGWREALEPFAEIARDKNLANHSDSYAPRPARGRPNMGDYRRALAALHPSVAEGRGKDNSAPANRGPV